MEQHTFSDKHVKILTENLGRMDTDAVKGLYRASYSKTFGEDLRWAIAKIYKPSAIREWEYS